MIRLDWRLALVVLVSVMAGFFLAGSGTLPSAHGQIEGQAGGVICVAGEVSSGYAPIILVDVPDQVLLFYEYSYLGRNIKFVAARSYRFDRRLTEFNNLAPTVQEIGGRVGGAP
jgi:hypothetical protein